jgi:hypothetical protein
VLTAWLLTFNGVDVDVDVGDVVSNVDLHGDLSVNLFSLSK